VLSPEESVAVLIKSPERPDRDSATDIRAN